MTNALNLQAPVDTLAMEFTREFDATVQALFHTVWENELVIQTFEFEGAPDMVNIESMWFEDLGDGRSRLRGRSICPNTEARDALLSSGMEGGMTEGYQKLDVLLKSL